MEKIEAAVDSGAVDIVGNPDDFPGIPVEQTEESKNGDYWVGPGGARVIKEGEMRVNWETDWGSNTTQEVQRHVHIGHVGEGIGGRQQHSAR